MKTATKNGSECEGRWKSKGPSKANSYAGSCVIASPDEWPVDLSSIPLSYGEHIEVATTNYGGPCSYVRVSK